ncbi:MAG TPA: SgcJ/EcaC family oxidoreductase [Candidatus Saccharimonadales bacterium]|jgi:uncharacterized protein (TIGR02246 family)|nr:SgcJ/EcaC family oxidoreductase [Candidatus Saccharimonadales bacterium]
MIFSKLKFGGAILAISLVSGGVYSAQMKPMVNEAGTEAVRSVVSAYDDGFNNHDAHAIGALFAEEGDFTNMRGSSKHGRKDIEQNYGNLLNGALKTAHRTDTIKNVKFITPDVAEIDADWEMTGTKAADGSDNPPRKGGLDWVVQKLNGKWMIVVFHESEYPK